MYICSYLRFVLKDVFNYNHLFKYVYYDSTYLHNFKLCVSALEKRHRGLPLNKHECEGTHRRLIIPYMYYKSKSPTILSHISVRASRQ